MTQPFDMDEETAAYAEAQRAEYSKWQAAEVITTPDGVVAYAPGAPVPIENTERLGYAKRGQVRLQPAYVEDNPDDPDVKTFLSYAKKNPEHPAVKEYEQYRESRAATEAAEAAVPRLTFGEEKPADKPARSAAAADAKTNTSKG